MPTYSYSCEIHDEFEIDHSINEVLEICPHCELEKLQSPKPKRLITKTTFILQGSGWAKDNYK